MRIALAVRDGAPGFGALQGVLARDLPRFAGRAPGLHVQTVELREQQDLARGLDESCLVIQGPPGTGKTFTGRAVDPAFAEQGKRVGVTAFSHNAIDNLLRRDRARRRTSTASVRGAQDRAGSAEYDGASSSRRRRQAPASTARTTS